MALYSMDWWVKIAQTVQGFLTPVIATLIGIITYRIQRQHTRTQQLQAETQRLQYRFGLIDRRMKVFDGTLDFIASVLRDGRIERFDPLGQLLRDTREHHLFFGAEIGDFINELYEKGLRLYTIHQASGPQQIVRPEDIQVQTEILHWFSGQTRVAEQKFLKYINFKEP